ncbi:MAG: T9SS type A sorting domain-containing protein, partial [candidate division WOR-3 bacterium]
DTINPSVLLRNNSLGVRSLYLTFVIDDYTGSEASIEIGEVGVGAADVETDDAGPGTTGAVIDLAEGTPPATGEADAVVYATIQGVTVPSADTVRVNFAVPWVATPSGTYFARTWHALLTDEDRSNDSLQQDFAVVGEGTDVALTQVVYPRSFEQSGTDMTPTLRCRNNGPSAVSFMGYVMLYDPYTDSLRYSEMKTVPSLESEATTLVEFPVINLGSDTGVWGAYCSLYCAGDIVPGNNVVSLSFTVSPEPPYEPGWTEMASMPLGPSGKPVKRGAWATLHVPTDRIYAAKGYKTTDFYSYDPYADLWDTLSGMPYTTHPMWGGRVPRKGSKGVSDGEDIIYVTQGNNTLGFWAYSVSMDSWWILPDVPLGDRRKKVKGGTDLLYLTEGDTGYVYLLKGYKNEFYRFNVVRRAWEPLENAPIGIREKYDKGSWLAHDPMTDANVMYAHKAKYHEFYKFRRDSLKWEQTNMGGMPFIGKMGRKKKSKDGGSADIWAGEIYALKGGNTQELWKYDDSLGWTELETIPAFGSTQRKKRVKYGADLVHWNYGIFFTLKGNKTVEWWRYVSHPSAAYSAPRRSGVMAEAVKVRRYGITVAPNPLSDGVAQVRFALPRTGPVTLSVFDMAGRAVEKQTVLAGRSGSARLDLRGLSAGVYLVKVEAGEYTDTRKLVVNH